MCGLLPSLLPSFQFPTPVLLAHWNTPAWLGAVSPTLPAFTAQALKKNHSCCRPVSGIHSLAAPAVAFFCRVRNNEVQNIEECLHLPQGLARYFHRRIWQDSVLIVGETLSFPEGLKPKLPAHFWVGGKPALVSRGWNSRWGWHNCVLLLEAKHSPARWPLPLEEWEILIGVSYLGVPALIKLARLATTDVGVK